MPRVLTFVHGRVDPERLDEIRIPYEAAIAAALPPALVATYLLTEPSGEVAIATFWRDRAALDVMLATGEEPLARRLIREAGGDPQVEIFNVLATSSGA